MARNLNYQFKTCIERNFSPGSSKHSLKVTGGINTGKIFSYSDKNNMKDFTKQFAGFMKENYSNIKMAKDINSDHCQKFLNSKQGTCSDATLKQYQSKFNKLEKIIGNTYNAKVDFGTIVPKSFAAKGKIRDKAMNRDDFNKVKGTFKNQMGNGCKSVELSARWGLRASEIAKLQARDIDLKNNQLRIIDSKGGRSRTLEIRQEDKSFANQLKIGCTSDYDRIVPIRKASINQAVSRAMEKLGLKDEYEKTAIHAIRKMAAQEYYDRCRENNMSIQESLGITSEYLGHSNERGLDMKLMRTYIENIW